MIAPMKVDDEGDDGDATTKVVSSVDLVSRETVDEGDGNDDDDDDDDDDDVVVVVVVAIDSVVVEGNENEDVVEVFVYKNGQ